MDVLLVHILFSDFSPGVETGVVAKFGEPGSGAGVNPGFDAGVGLDPGPGLSAYPGLSAGPGFGVGVGFVPEPDLNVGPKIVCVVFALLCTFLFTR